MMPEIFVDPMFATFVGVLVAGSVFMLTLISTNAALVLLIVAMLFSPEMNLAQVPGRSVVIRFDDLLLIVIFFSWLAKLAINKQLGLLRSTPMNVPVGLYIASCVVSTVLGILRGDVSNLVAGTFYLLKSLEYFVLYFMVVNIVQHPGQIRIFLRFLLLTAAAVGLFSYFQIASHGPGYRITAPFEGKAEPNTLAGYLVLMIALCLGQLLCRASPNGRVRALALTLFLLPPLIFTYSRGGYLSFLTMYVTLIFLSTQNRLPLAAVLAASLLLAPMVLPHTVFDRLADTFDPRSQYEIGNMRIAGSPAGRIFVWKYIIEKWSENPAFGLGITGIGFVDTQYGLLVGEVGIVGLLAFFFVQGRLWMVCYQAYRTVTDPDARGLCLGFLVGHIGMMAHALSGNVFLIVRIMEPFWFIAAMVTVLPHLKEVLPAAVIPKPMWRAGPQLARP